MSGGPSLISRFSSYWRLAQRLFASVAVLVSTLFVGCAITPNPPQQVAPISQAATVSAPLRLCPANDQAPTEVRSKPGYIQIVASVSDASGRPVIRLKQSDFDIHNAGRNIQSVYFHEDSAGLPASVVILIDSSGSMLTKLPKVQTSLGAFLKNVKQCDEVALLSFTSLGGVKVLQSFTTDHALVADSLAFVVPNGETPLYDAIHDGLQALRSAHYPNRSIILITDGMDSSSAISKADLIAEAHTTAVPIYAIGIGDPNAGKFPVGIVIGPFALGSDFNRVDSETLNAIADAAGGRAFIVPLLSKDSGTGFDSALASISDILDNGYTIGIIAPSSSAPLVTIIDRPTVAARVRIASGSSGASSP